MVLKTERKSSFSPQGHATQLHVLLEEGGKWRERRNPESTTGKMTLHTEFKRLVESEYLN